MELIKKLRTTPVMLYWALPQSLGPKQKKKWEEVLESDNYFLTEKRDGVFMRFSKDHEGKCLLQSRTISKKTGSFVERQENVPHVIEELNNWLPNSSMVVGEIFLPVPNSTSSDVVSVLNCLPKESLRKQEKIKLHYYIFDIVAINGQDLREQGAENRQTYLQAWARNDNFKKTKYLEVAEPILNNFLISTSNIIEYGGEGSVLMRKEAKYVEGRSAAWDTIKLKRKMDTVDLVIMGFSNPVKEYTGKYLQQWSYWENLKTGELVEGFLHNNPGFQAVSQYYFKSQPSGLILGAWYQDNLLEVCTVANLTDEMREDIKENPEKYLHKVAEIGAMEIDYKRRNFRHPKLIKIRDDKDSKECMYEEIFRLNE